MAVTSDLDRYRRVAPLGAGGMSTVELAEDTLLGRQVALKRLHRDDIRGNSRLRREALTGASLTHPNLVSIFDILTTEDGDHVIVMEYVEGETLAQRLRRGKLDLDTALGILTGVSAGLDAINAQRIVHRDVKPGNILLGSDGSVKLADLGIAAVSDRTRLTTDGAVLGTFSYMAPEQLEGALATPALDVYALAAVAYETLSGRRARTEPNPVALAHAISTQPPPDLRTVLPEAPAEAAEVLRRGMSRDPRQRPRTAGELMARLRAAYEPQTTARVMPTRPRAAAIAPVPGGQRRITPRRVPPPRSGQVPPRRAGQVPPPRPGRGSRSRRWALGLAALTVAGLAAVIILAASSGGSQPTPAASVTKPANKSSHRHARSTGSQSTGTGAAAGAASANSTPPAPAGGGAAASAAGGGGAPAATGGSPTAAVESFYHLAAAHQYSSAWALADPAFRNQLGGYPAFESGQSADRSITFNSAQVTGQSPSTATVYVRTTSVRTSGTQHCYGPVNLVRSSSSWLLDHIDINCG